MKHDLIEPVEASTFPTTCAVIITSSGRSRMMCRNHRSRPKTTSDVVAAKRKKEAVLENSADPLDVALCS